MIPSTSSDRIGHLAAAASSFDQPEMFDRIGLGFLAVLAISSHRHIIGNLLRLGQERILP